MLNQTSEHAVRALLFLARTPVGEAISAERIARALGAPANYLGKTLNSLARRGMVRSTRGPQGGYRLMRAPAEITLADVAELFEEPRGRSICLLGDRPCSAAAPCRAHHQWAAACHAAAEPLRRTTLAHLLDPDSDRDATSPLSQRLASAAAPAA